MFLARNHVPYLWLELERDDEAQRLLGLFAADDSALPLVLLPDSTALHGATMVEIADALGLRTRAESRCTTWWSSGPASGPGGGRVRRVGRAAHGDHRT